MRPKMVLQKTQEIILRLTSVHMRKSYLHALKKTLACELQHMPNMLPPTITKIKEQISTK